MISIGELNVFGIIFNLESLLCFLPVERGSSRFQLKFSPNKYRWFMYYFLRFFSMSYFIFAVLRVYPSYLGYRILYPAHYTLFHFIYIVLHVFSVMFDTVFGWYGTRIIELYNQLVKFNTISGYQQF